MSRPGAALRWDRPGRSGRRGLRDCPSGRPPVRRRDAGRRSPRPLGRPHGAVRAPPPGSSRGPARATPRPPWPHRPVRRRRRRARRGRRDVPASALEGGAGPGCGPPPHPPSGGRRTRPERSRARWARPGRAAAPTPRTRGDHERRRRPPPRGGDDPAPPRRSPDGRGRQLLAALPAPCLDHLPPPGRGHSDPKAVGLPAIALLRLVRALDGSALRRSMPPSSGAHSAPHPTPGVGRREYSSDPSPGAVRVPRARPPQQPHATRRAPGSTASTAPAGHVVTPRAHC